MAGQDGSFDTDARLRWLSAAGDPLVYDLAPGLRTGR